MSKHFPIHPDSSITSPQKDGAVPCHRCGGSGFVPPFGWCFRCGGQTTDPTERKWLFPRSWTADECQAWEDARLAKNAKARQRSEARRQAEAEKVWTENVERFPALAEMDAIVCAEGGSDRFPSFALDIRLKALRFPLSDRQGEAVTKVIEETLAEPAEEPEAAEVPAWEPGRQLVEGEVKTRRFVNNDFGGSVKLRIVDAEGRGLWVTEPSAIITEVGDRVRMTVTVEPSGDDPAFAFGKRPTKAEVLEEATA